MRKRFTLSSFFLHFILLPSSSNFQRHKEAACLDAERYQRERQDYDASHSSPTKRRRKKGSTGEDSRPSVDVADSYIVRGSEARLQDESHDFPGQDEDDSELNSYMQYDNPNAEIEKERNAAKFSPDLVWNSDLIKTWQRKKRTFHPGIVRAGVAMLLAEDDFSPTRRRGWGRPTPLQSLAEFRPRIESYTHDLSGYISSQILGEADLHRFLGALSYATIAAPFHYSQPRKKKTEFVSRSLSQWRKASKLADRIEKEARKRLWSGENVDQYDLSWANYEIKSDRGYSEHLVARWLAMSPASREHDRTVGINLAPDPALTPT